MLKIPRSYNYAANARRLRGDDEACCVCGKPIKPGNNNWVRTWFGSYVVTAAEAETLPPRGDTGAYPIGKGCLRRHPELRPYLFQGDDA